MDTGIHHAAVSGGLMSFLFADNQRLHHNVVRLATVAEIDWGKRLFRARSGEIVTDWLPFPAVITHNYRHWLPLRLGTQLILLVDGGDYNTAVVVGMLWSDDISAPDDAPPEQRPFKDMIVFNDGTRIEYDSQSALLSIECTGKVQIKAQSIELASESLTHNGKNIGATHRHQSGGTPY